MSTRADVFLNKRPGHLQRFFVITNRLAIYTGIIKNQHKYRKGHFDTV